MILNSFYCNKIRNSVAVQLKIVQELTFSSYVYIVT